MPTGLGAQPVARNTTQALLNGRPACAKSPPGLPPALPGMVVRRLPTCQVATGAKPIALTAAQLALPEAELDASAAGRVEWGAGCRRSQRLKFQPRLKPPFKHLGGSAAGQAFLFNKLLTWLRVGVSNRNW